MTLLELSPAGGSLALRDVAEVAVAALLGLLAWQGKKLLGKVELMGSTLDKWSVVLFGYEENGKGLIGDVERIKEWRRSVTELTPEEVGRYDRRSSFREAVEREKAERRPPHRLLQHEEAG